MIFGINEGFSKRKRVIFALREICEEKRCDFLINGGFAKRKRDFFLNGGFSKRKRVIFAYMVDLRRVNVFFLLNCWFLYISTVFFTLIGSFLRELRMFSI